MALSKSAQPAPHRRPSNSFRRRLRIEELEKRLPLRFDPPTLSLPWSESSSTAVPLEPAEGEGTVGARIVGGFESTPGAWPWLASIQHFNSHFCGGALIAPSWILTAAHCVMDGETSQPAYNLSRPSGLTVVLGRHDLSTAVGTRLIVERIVPHPDYDPAQNAQYNKLFDSDLALLKLASPATQSPIPLARLSDAARYAPGVDAVVAGWGVTVEDGSVSTTLQQVAVPIVSNATAQAAYLTASYGIRTITENMLAAGFAEGGKDACQGDSGGPLMVQSESGTYLHAGVVSFGQGCARPRYYGIYTRTANFTNWISAVTTDLAVTSLSPADDAINVALDSRLQIHFNEPIRKGTGWIKILDGATNNVVYSWQVTDTAIQVNGSSVVITPPEPFRQNGSYYVQITSGAFEDLAGFDFLGYSGTTAWNFRTGDTLAPQWVRLQPLIGNSQVSLDTLLELQFNEPIKKGAAGQIRLRRVSEPTQLDTLAISSSAIEVSGSTVIIRPPQRLVGSASYQVEIDNGALTDWAGNAFAGFTGNSWNFRTALSPTLLDPPDNAVGIGLTPLLTMTFSGEVRRGLAGTISLRRRSDQGLAFPAVQVTSAAVDVAGNQVTIRIPQALAEKTEYFVEVSSGAFTDAAGLTVSGIQGSTADKSKGSGLFDRCSDRVVF